ncbi:MAG: ATP-binding cassette domain-containing protein [Xanthobacteraceae bacterium]|uniref:branched-chain amino acid ABC transporter ATP-binding protein/permease n=1 Tax=Pseudolabrys sp. TaxID=1960880 RepID=UPI003D0E0891
MNRIAAIIAGLVVVAALAAVPLFAGGYHLALGISLLYFAVLATSWALFSGPTHYISLASAAFFGIGAYTTAVLAELMPWPLVLVCAALVGLVVALVVGLSTLRLSGIYFVIFSFGLAEMIRQLVTWSEVNIAGSVGRYVFMDVTAADIYWRLLALAVAVFAAGWAIGRSRLGLAVRVIGQDETVARHCGIDATRAKLALFAVSAVFMTLTGAIMAPRWTYIDPNIAFNPVISFEVVIMALLGGAGRLFGPLLGVVPLVLLFEFLTIYFPSYFSILLGAVFILIVYALPEGVTGLLERHVAALKARTLVPRLSGAAEAVTRFIWPRPLARAGAERETLLEVENVRRRFGGLTAVDGLSFTLKRGEILGLIGPNGSGKTTALNLVSGALAPDEGAIRLKGATISNAAPHRIAQLGVARTFQLVRVLGASSCLDNVLTGLVFHDPPRWGETAATQARALLERVGLGAAAALPAGQLTYIDQKRLELARALALAPDVLLLDEWLAGLNPSELHEGIALVKSLRDQGLTIVIVEHVMDAIRSLCDRCVVMNTGRKIAEGTPAAVLADREVIRAYLGDDDA